MLLTLRVLQVLNLMWCHSLVEEEGEIDVVLRCKNPHDLAYYRHG